MVTGHNQGLTAFPLRHPMRAPEQPDQIERQPDTTPLRVLLVEDDEDDSHLLARYFERAGYRPIVHRVETADEMRRALNQPDVEWDVVLADFNLPTFSAPAALRLLKHMGRDVPFIIMSGAISEETAVDAMRAGAHDYVSKQNLARLVPAIEREIREARARRLQLDAEQALRTSQERFLRLVQAMPVGLIIAEPDGTVQYANTSIERLLGYSEQELRSGAVDFGSIFGAEGPTVLTRLQAITTDESRRPFETLCRTSTRPVSSGADRPRATRSRFLRISLRTGTDRHLLRRSLRTETQRRGHAPHREAGCHRKACRLHRA